MLEMFAWLGILVAVMFVIATIDIIIFHFSEKFDTEADDEDRFFVILVVNVVLFSLTLSAFIADKLGVGI